MNCKNCGAPLFAGDKFCGECGAMVLPDHTQDPMTQTADLYSGFRSQDPRAGAQPQIPAMPAQAGRQMPGQMPQVPAARPPKVRQHPKMQEYAADQKSPAVTAITAVLGVLLGLLLLYTVFNVLIMCDVVDVSGSQALSGYKSSLSEFLGITETPAETDEPAAQTAPADAQAPQAEVPTVPQTEAPAPIATVPAVPETTAAPAVPASLQPYASGLVAVNRTYRVTLEEEDWNINYRSSPRLIEKDAPGYNVIGKLKNGTEIYVEYIYNETWAVFTRNGEYVFASLYAENDPTQNRLLRPV